MSAFTALNGGSPKAGELPSITVADRPAEKITAPDQSPSISPATRTHAEAELSPRDKGDRTVHGADRPAFQPTGNTDGDSTSKRKRSESPESRVESSTRNRSPDVVVVSSLTEARHRYGTPQKEYRQYHESDARDRESWQPAHGRDERSPYETQQNSVTPTHANAEDQLGEALHRATMDHSDYANTSPDIEDRPHSLYGSYPPDHRQDSILQHDPKKRKRNFSNRTKTGCLTCRKRKKKCDEQKPECSNCIRGGFLCAGYPPQRGPGWQKPDNKAAAVPLESKDPSYVPPGAYGMPQQQAPYAKRDSVQHYRGQALRIDPPQGRPLVTDDDRLTASTLPSASVASPDNKPSAISSFASANVFPTPVSANTPYSERMTKDFRSMPPLHDISRNEPETPHPGNQLPHINILHATRTSSPAPHHPPQAPTSNAQVAAQLALSHSQFPARRTQKEEMLAGRHYYPFDKELCLERERCAAACWRFNNLTSPPTNGVSPEERARLFLEILQPRDPIRAAEVSPVTKVGRIGRHVAVETPFTCDYGYNISIGNHVSIGRNCTINDVCEVKIGDNCVIGPNVSVYTATLPIDPKKRQGGQGPQLGSRITIEADCWIGGGATILPGRTIGKGSTVGAGSIVTKDVPPFTVVAGNPARVLRGIASA